MRKWWFFARQDVTQHGHQDLDEAKICTRFFCISFCIYSGNSRSSSELPSFCIEGHFKLASPGPEKNGQLRLTLHCLRECHNSVADFFEKKFSAIRPTDTQFSSHYATCWGVQQPGQVLNTSCKILCHVCRRKLCNEQHGSHQKHRDPH